jgi:putative membrane protein
MEARMSTAAHLPDSNQLAMDRTWLAHERTLMAWVRTATSMISFGFTIYKFFEFQAEKSEPGKHGVYGLFSPRDFALMMVSIGLLSLLAATISHRRDLRSLRGALPGRRSLAEVIAWLVSGFGLVVLLSALFRD